MFQIRHLQSRAATAENVHALPGEGGKAGGGRKGSPCIEDFKAGQTRVLLDQDGPGIIRHMWMTIPPGNINHMRNLILRMYWDHQEHPSVEVPLGDFYGVAHGRSKPMYSECVSMQEGRGLNCWIPMPFRKHARITIENDSDVDVWLFFYQIDFTLGDELDENTGYFHAQFRRNNPCPLHEDYTILEVEGSGRYLGTVLGVRSLYKAAWWGEGEVKFYIDDDDAYPTICGTGTEDYMGSAWGLGEVLTPWQGASLVDNEAGLYSIYRFHVKDPIYFQKRLKVTVQQIGLGVKEKLEKDLGPIRHYKAAGVKEGEGCYYDRSDDYCSVAYWYQLLPTKPFPALPDRAARLADLQPPAKDEVKRQDLVE